MLDHDFLLKNPLQAFATIIFNTSNDSMFIMAVEPGDVFRCFAVNDSYLKNTRLKPEQVIGKTIDEVFPENARQTALNGYQEAIRTKKTVHYKETVDFGFGEDMVETSITPVFDQNDVCTHLIGASKDINQQRQAERSLTESEDRYKLLADNVSDSISLYDENDQLVYLSPSTSVLSGYPMEELMNIPFLEFIHPDDRELLAQKIAFANENKLEHQQFEYRFKHKNGHFIWVETVGRRIFDKNGNLHRTINVSRDITFRKQAGLLLEERNRKFEFLSRSATEMLDLPDVNSLYQYITKSIHQYFPNTIIATTKVDEITKTTKIHNISGFDNKFLARVQKITGFQMLGKTFKLLPENQLMYKTGKISEFHGGISDLASNDLPEYVTRAIQKITGIHKIYAIGINYDNKLLAVIHFFTVNKTEITDNEFIESFVKQAGIVIQRKLLEEQLRFHAMILDQIQDRVTVTDLDGNITFVNKAVEQMFKFNPEGYIGKSVKSYGENPEKGATQQEIIDKTRKNGSWRGRVVNYDSTGKEIYLDVRTRIMKNSVNEPIWMCGISTDITEQIKQEELIKESEKRYQNLFDSMADGFSLNKIITDNTGKPIDWQFVMVNRAHENHTGLKLEDTIGKTIKEIFPDVEQEWIDFYGEVALTGKSNQKVSFNHNTGNFYEVNAFCPSPGNFAAVFNNITNRKNAERQLLEAKEKAEAADRLKTAFLNNISHEVRTPLNGILGFGELISEPGISEENKKQYLDILTTSSHRLMQTITDYMDISLITSETLETHLQETKPSELVQECFNDYQDKCISKNLSLSIELPDGSDKHILVTDKNLTQKSLYHLVENAYKFTNSGQISFGYRMVDEGYEFFVKDTGVGISQPMQERIFENFIQEDLSTTRGYEGSGLGLSIVKGITSLLGWNIRLESAKGQGTTFYLTIPKKQRPISPPNKKKTLQQPEKTNEFVILIVEDDESSFYYFDAIFKRYSLTTFLARNGNEAITLCREHPEIDLVLMDLKMPVMNGFEATRIIKKMRPGLPVIAQTAFALSGDEFRAHEAGCDDYITKPIRKKILIEKMKKFGFEEQRMLRE